jgi:hypothetical protein
MQYTDGTSRVAALASRTFTLALPLVALLSGACMVHPYDGTVVGSIDTPINFDGLVTVETGRVDIKAFNFQTGEWDVIATASPQPEDKQYAMEFSGYTWYVWRAQATLGGQYWKAGAHGFKASVTASTGPVPLMASREDLIPCFSAHKDGGTDAVYSNCAAPHSPVARIQTIDYEPPNPAPLLDLTGRNPLEVGDLPPFPQPCFIEQTEQCFLAVQWCFYRTYSCTNPGQNNQKWNRICGTCLGIGPFSLKCNFISGDCPHI